MNQLAPGPCSIDLKPYKAGAGCAISAQSLLKNAIMNSTIRGHEARASSGTLPCMTRCWVALGAVAAITFGCAADDERMVSDRAAAGAAGASSGAAGSSGAGASQTSGAAGAGGSCGAACNQGGAGTAGTAGESASAGAGGDSQTRKGLRGAFLLVLNSEPASFYEGAVDEMAELGMDQLIVQTESYLTQPSFGRNAVDRALLRAVLDRAAQDGLAVSLGLALPEWGNGDVSAAVDADFVDGVIAASKSSLDTLLSEFADESAWTGCYLPLELWTPGSDGQLGELLRYVSEVSQYVRQKRACVVSISPFISDLASDDGVLTESAYAPLFAEGAVDVVFLQDGVGARGQSSEQIAGNMPYYAAMQRACASHCVVWANVESFEPDFTTPAAWSRFQVQIETLRDLVPDQVTYEYSHYFMASGPGGSAAAALHDAYSTWLAAP